MSTVLVVEDNHLEIQLFKSFLETIGYDVLVATNGDDALELLAHHEVVLILMDLRLPGGMSGWDIAQRIRADLSIVYIPIILMTAHDFPNDKQRVLDIGCEGLIIKPINMRLLRELIQEYDSHGETKV